MAVNKKIKELYMSFWEKPELFVANLISDIQERTYLRKFIDKKSKLTKEQKKQIKDYWKPYKKISTKWCLYYSSKNEKFDPRYIPIPYITQKLTSILMIVN